MMLVVLVAKNEVYHYQHSHKKNSVIFFGKLNFSPQRIQMLLLHIIFSSIEESCTSILDTQSYKKSFFIYTQSSLKTFIPCQPLFR